MINQLTKGSKYRIVHASSAEENISTEGILEGFVTMGEEPALLMKIAGEEKERLRIIPFNTVLYIDVLEQSEDGEREEKRGDVSYIS